MKKFFIVLSALAIAGNVIASPAYDESPTKSFSTSSNRHETVKITWLTSDNPNALCNKEAKKRGYKNFGYSLQACAFWDSNVCTIITSKNPTMHNLGHEVRHCYQGDWHTENGQ